MEIKNQTVINRISEFKVVCKSLARLIKKERQKAQMKMNRNEKGGIPQTCRN
jgi:hypothetical protein